MLGTGEVRLRPVRDDDAPHFVRWSADADFAWLQWARLTGHFATAEAVREAFFARFVAPEARLFVIEHDGKPIGFANYRDLRAKPRSAEIGIGIGEPGLWGRGIGRAALAVLLRHLTGDLGLHRVTLHVVAYNHRAIAAYRASGFEVEGIQRDAVLTGRGHYTDAVAMAYLVGRASRPFDPAPVTLEGRHVRLEPLRAEHAPELLPVAIEAELWEYSSIPAPISEDAVRLFVRDALDRQTAGEQVAWLTRRLADGRAIGSTRYSRIARADRGLEIGWTFLAKDARGTSANAEAKYLQLTHAFEVLGALRVGLQADERNARSRAAMERIGARFEGIHRRDRINHDGFVRSSAIYAITSEDWPDVRTSLQRRLDRS